MLRKLYTHKFNNLDEQTNSWKKIKLYLNLTPYTKSYSKQIIYLNLKWKIIKLLGKKQEKIFGI